MGAAEGYRSVYPSGETMDLVIVTDTLPPTKSQWSSPNLSDRDGWSEIYEAITNWFCISNGFRSENNLDVVIVQSSVKVLRFNGSSLRYLSPQLRSAASLLSKASNLSSETWKESTPGVTVRSFRDFGEYTQSIREMQRIKLGSKEDGDCADGMVLLFDPKSIVQNVTKTLPSTFEHINQFITWQLNLEY